MAQLAETSIFIGSKRIEQFSSFTLSQAIFEHHQFHLVCPAEAIDKATGDLFNSSKDFIGEQIHVQIRINANEHGGLRFSGVVTQVEAVRSCGHTGDIIFSGFSPTILMDNAPHCKSWEEKNISQIARDIVSHFPKNFLESQIAPQSGEFLLYTVQYKETAWQFLKRLSAHYGEWLYYDGRQLILGPTQGHKSKLVFGSNLNHFNIGLQAQPVSFQVKAYDYINHEVYDSSPQNIDNKAGLNDLGKLVLQKSQQLYNTQPKYWHNHFLVNKKQLDDLINIRTSIQASNMVCFNGTCDNPDLQIGCTISVLGKNIFSQVDESLGEYTVIALTHYCDDQGNYTNDVVAIPSTLKLPPIIGNADIFCETQSALVTDNHDPKGLGRIRVKFHWMKGNEKTPWLRISSPHSGGNKGMFFLPEIGEEVMVGFEGNSPVKPFVLGTVYHGKAKTEFSNSGNDIKAIQTRSGNKVIINDKQGSIKIADPSGNTVILHGNGQISIHAPKEITLSSTDIHLRADNSINLYAGSKENKDAATLSLNAAKQINLHAKEKISAAADKDLDLSSGEKLSASTNEFSIKASASTQLKTGKLTIDGGSKAIITSSDTDIF